MFTERERERERSSLPHAIAQSSLAVFVLVCGGNMAAVNSVATCIRSYGVRYN